MHFIKSLTAFTMCAAVLSSCSSDDDITPTPEPTPGDQGKFIVAVNSGSSSSTSYVLTTDNLDSGKISVVGQGLQTSQKVTNWIFHNKGILFGIMGRGGSVYDAASYVLDAETSKVKELFEYKNLPSNLSHGILRDNALCFTTKQHVDGNDFQTLDDNTKVYPKYLAESWLSGLDGKHTPKSRAAENFVGNGEAARMTNVVEAGGKVYAPVYMDGRTAYSMKKWPNIPFDKELVAPGIRNLGGQSIYTGEIPVTQFPDSAWVAVYNSVSDFENENGAYTVMRTGKMPAAYGGSWSNPTVSTFATADGEYVYLFSSSDARNHKGFRVAEPGVEPPKTQDPAFLPVELKTVVGTKPASVMRIKAGSTEFDSSFDVVNLQAGNAGDRTFYECWYMSGHNFLLNMYSTEGNYSSSKNPRNLLAIFNGETKQINLVSGLPSIETIKSVSDPYTKDNLTYIAVTTTKNEFPVIYIIDAAKQSATKGATIEADDVVGIGYLPAKK